MVDRIFIYTANLFVEKFVGELKENKRRPSEPQSDARKLQ